ncbi:MAG: hypothetical protein Q4A31_02600 [Corynebacterium sp.]|uniref:membrane protein YczE n=1 Tax=Corynebacterium sp. TaxID=1720 RepID=UPI0026DA8C52|nr:hypothetical protein [Corynebacterium sp.]MDO4760795.1 hypothetical protein [Corynebacterium sp.]
MAKKTLENLSIRQQLTMDRLPLRLVVLFIGLTGFGMSAAMLIKANMGADPWNVLHIALGEISGLSVGIINIGVAFLVLMLWIPLKLKPGIGTLANATWLGVSIDIGMAYIPEATTLASGMLMAIAAVASAGLCGAIYVAAQLGPGPRDGLMSGLHIKYGWRIGRVRTILEISVLSIGFLLGGPIGIGTVLYAFGVGPIIGFVLPHILIPVKTGAPVTVVKQQDSDDTASTS